MVSNAERLLKKHELRKTSVRLSIIDELNEVGHALSHQDFETSLGNRVDRVTIYRTLNTFEQSGLVHRIIDDQGVALYALCKSGCGEHHHKDSHVHLKCSSCQKTYCLHDVKLPEVVFPEKVAINRYKVLAEGVCEYCLPLSKQ